MIDPKSVVCPDCEAAVGAMCRMIQNGNITYVTWIHVTRLQAALNPTGTTSTPAATAKPPLKDLKLEEPKHTESKGRTF